MMETGFLGKLRGIAYKGPVGGCGWLTMASINCMGTRLATPQRHDSYTGSSIPHDPTRNT